MKYLKKYNESKSPLNSLSDDDLRERLKWLTIEYKEIEDEMLTIRKILTTRQEESEEIHSRNLPDSVFDLNKEQFDWVFEHNHGTTSKRYEISGKYIKQLSGVHDGGFNRDTNQFYFNIVTSHSFNRRENNFELKPEVIKSIRFLGDNLKRTGDYVEFGVLYSFYEHGYNDHVLYYSEDDIQTGSWGNVREFNSIENLLKYIVDYDISSRDDD
jgi:hypothetical protein